MYKHYGGPTVHKLQNYIYKYMEDQHCTINTLKKR